MHLFRATEPAVKEGQDPTEGGAGILAPSSFQVMLIGT